MANRTAVPGQSPEGTTDAAISRGSVGSVRRPASAWVSWSLTVAAIMLSVGMVVLAIADGDLFMIVLAPGPIVAALMGGLVAARRPGQPMGPLLSAFGLSGAACNAAFGYAHAAVIHDPRLFPAGRVMMWATSWDYVPPITFLVLILPLVFPDGRLVSPRWRPALWAAAAFAVLAIVGNAFEPQSMGGWFGDRQLSARPRPALPSGAGRGLDWAFACDTRRPVSQREKLEDISQRIMHCERRVTEAYTGTWACVSQTGRAGRALPGCDYWAITVRRATL
jgi:hypothetical protein